MPVVIIKDTERLSKVIDGATFYYKRVPSHIRNQFLAECTTVEKRVERTDWGEYGQKLMRHGLLGWHDVVDQTGEQIEFLKELIGYLPDATQAKVIELLGENTNQMEDALKNSPSTQSSKPSIEV